MMKNELTTTNPELEELVEEYFAATVGVMRAQEVMFAAREQVHEGLIALHLENDPVCGSLKGLDLTLPNSRLKLTIRHEIMTRGYGTYNTNIRIDRPLKPKGSKKPVREGGEP